ncbi:hypothetical protein K461DRAFT_277730 [Myriangium duriaei CBS 260.36]|uniref:Membrane anchor Opy2 N-terminal domain-containing protein n=1 Tax=Myriangium duriaei CBS 260.36 TaxID=1168546 RepID=A0A9P4MMQ3_9PEZI|nr:hypothetical protein K461DRAFT_277730 [Myriangium duriaei CBS 260.36]
MDSLQLRQDCAAPFVFYSCSNGFRGCCSSNPCNPAKGCPAADTPDGKPTIISSGTMTSTAAPSSKTTNSPSSTTSTSSTSSSSSSISLTPDPTITPDPSSSATSSTAPSATQSLPATLPKDADSGPSAGVIAGSVVGGLIGLLALIALALFFLRRRRTRNRQRSTLTRRDSMKAVEGGGDGGIFAQNLGFYRGNDKDKPLSASADSSPELDREEQTEAPYSDTPSTPKSPNRPMYRVVNAESAATTPVAPTHPSNTPSININPVQLDSTSVARPPAEMEGAQPPAEMADTSRPASYAPAAFPRWSQHGRTSSGGTTTYKPYRPPSAVTNTSITNISTPGLTPVPSTAQVSRTNSHAMSWNDHTSATAQGAPDDLASNFIPSPLASPTTKEPEEHSPISPAK